MKEISVLGIDLAKSIFHFYGVDEHGKAVVSKKVRRGQVLETVAKLAPTLIGLEACPGSNYWARAFRKLGLDVRIIAPQFVKPYVKSQKNDAHDAEAIVEAMMRAHMRFVPIKEIAHQDIQCIHRVRSRLIRNRTRLSNEIRGLLAEYGIVFPLKIYSVKKKMPLILEDAENELTDRSRSFFQELLFELYDVEKRIAVYDQKIQEVYIERKEVCDRLLEVPGVGILTATAILSAVSDPHQFKNGRHLAAYFGLVPRQVSTGGKTILRGITKHGDRHIRTLLIHGARATMRHSKNKTDKRSQWIQKKIETRGVNKTCVAIANKNARIIWNLLAKNERYRKAA
jgi:transposase